MRALLGALGALLLAAGGWLLGPPWPLRLELELLARPQAPAAWQGPVVRAVVHRTVPGLEGWALGDAVQFDRYGVLAPGAGTVDCVTLAPGASPEVRVTPLGGRITHGAVTLEVLAAPTAVQCPTGVGALVSPHP